MVEVDSESMVAGLLVGIRAVCNKVAYRRWKNNVAVLRDEADTFMFVYHNRAKSSLSCARTFEGDFDLALTRDASTHDAAFAVDRAHVLRIVFFACCVEIAEAIWYGRLFAFREGG